MLNQLVFTTHNQGRIQEFALSDRPLPFLPLPALSLPFLRSRAPLNQLGGLGSAVSSRKGVRGDALAENEFGVRKLWESHVAIIVSMLKCMFYNRTSQYVRKCKWQHDDYRPQMTQRGKKLNWILKIWGVTPVKKWYISRTYSDKWAKLV